MITQVTWTLTERREKRWTRLISQFATTLREQSQSKSDTRPIATRANVRSCIIAEYKVDKVNQDVYINNKNKSLNNLRHPTPHSRQQHGTLTCTSLLQCCSAADTHVPPPSCPQVTLELRCYLTSCCRSVRCGVERERERGGVKPSAKHVYQQSRMFHSQDLSQRHQVPYIVTEV